MGEVSERLTNLAERLAYNADDFIYIKTAVLSQAITVIEEDAEENSNAFNILVGNINDISHLQPSDKTAVYKLLQKVFCEWLVPNENGNVRLPKSRLSMANIILDMPAWRIRLTNGSGDHDTISNIGLAFALINSTRASENKIEALQNALSTDVILSLMMLFRIMLVFIYESQTPTVRIASTTYFSLVSQHLQTIHKNMLTRTIVFQPFPSAMISFLARYMNLLVTKISMTKKQVAFILDSMDDLMLGHYEDCFDIRKANKENVHNFATSFGLLV